MSIKRVSIPSDFALEGELQEKGRKDGVVICHPHPLYGGNMYSNVVAAIENGFVEKGFTTLRFNFRGVGMSKGVYDDGTGEVNDVIASATFLKGHLDEDARIMLAGYSFGAWMASKAAASMEGVCALFLVAYPFAFYESDELKRFEKSIYFVGGKYDDICPLNSLLSFYNGLSIVEKSLKIIPTDHFYSGKEGEIVEFIKSSVA